MNEVVERAVRLWILTQNKEDLSLISQEIQAGSATLVELVKILGPYLTSEETETRVNGVTMLVEVIAKLPDTCFTRQSTRVINAFLLSKLDTVEEVIPALKGLLRISSMSTYTTSDCKEALEQLFKIPMKAHVQSTRHVVFLIVDSFMTCHRSALQNLGPTFVKGYISLVENEKDPRNLLVAFALDRVIMLEFEISEFVEQFYDITFCYFPITFKAPPNDPYGVTGPDLVVALRNCLSASPLLGPLGMPLFIEKLNVGTPATKKDTLATVAVCLPIYGKAVADNTADKLWDGLKIEIFQPVDVEVQDAAIEVTKTLVLTCHLSGSNLAGIGQRILNTCLEHLNEPSTSQGQIAVKLVSALADSSDEIAEQIMQEVIPKLMNIYETSPEHATRTSILTALTAILQAKRPKEASTTPTSDSDKRSSLLSRYKGSLLSLFISAVKISSTTEQGLKGTQQLVQMLSLEKEELNFVIHTLTTALLQVREADDDLVPQTLIVIQTLSSLSPDSVESVALPPLFALLPDTPPREDDNATQANCVRALSALETICVQPQLFSRLLVHLSTKVELLVLAQEKAGSATIAYAHALMKTMHSALVAKSARGDADIPKYMEGFVPRLYFLFFDALNKEETVWIGGYNVLVSDAADIISLIVASATPERQGAWSTALFDAFFGGKLSSVTSHHAVTADIPSFRPLELNGNRLHDSLVPLFTAGLIGLHAEAPVSVSDVNGALGQLLHVAATSESAEKRGTLSRVISSMLNKRANECRRFIETILAEFWTEYVMKEEVATQQRAGALELWASAVQALIVRNHPSSISLARQLFLLFEDGLMAFHAAKLLGKMPDLRGSPLERKYHAVVRLLYGQRLFNALIPEILEGFNSAISSTRSTAYLITLSNLVSSVPKGTSSQLINTLFPLLLRGLDLPDLELRANIAESLVAVIEGDDVSNGIEAITSHLGALVSRLLRNTRANRHARESVRLKIGAIRFLAGLVEKMKQEDIQPYKAEVLRELQSALDDPSRMVRREAVLARSKWYAAWAPV